MKVLLISPLPPPAGGIASWTKIYLASNKVKENNVDIVNIAVSGERVQSYTKINITDEIKRFIKIIMNLNTKINSNKYDIVHLNSACSPKGLLRDYLCALMVKRKGIKLVSHFRCDVTYMLKGNFARFIFKKLCEKTDRIFSLNTVSKEYIKSDSGIDSIIMPNFIDNNIIKNTFTVNPNIKKIIYVGHVMKSKGCYEIIEAAKKLADKDFILVGHITEEFRNIALPDNIKLIGEVEKNEVFNYLNNADLFLFPTYSEGFPNVIIEAMACGLPIIASAVGAIPDMIEDKGGYLIDVGNVQQIIDAIIKSEDSNLRQSMSDWNIEKVKKSYLLDTVMDKIFDEYEKLVIK
ncbi:MAG: glycosyltransferase family 4 protein [bacterium]